MGKINYRSDEEVELIRHSSLLVGKTLAEVAKNVKPGVSTLELDAIAEDFIKSHDARPGFKGYNGFPGSLCTSVNEEVVHGIPTKDVLKEGDIVSVDCGVVKNGYWGDSAYTFKVGEVSEEIELLLQRTRESLNLAIEVAVSGNRVGDIGFAVQSYCESFGYGVVRELVGHGVGADLHEAPEVPNYGRKGNGPKLKEGMVLAIEPMINLGSKSVRQKKDGWTIITADGKSSAHFEHDVLVRKGQAEVLSTFDYIEEVLKTR